MAFYKLKERIKINEGYSARPYKDQLGFYTIGYGHLIKPQEKKYFKKSFKKKYFDELFEVDFSIALKIYNNQFYKKRFNKRQQELVIEMLFQLGEKNVLRFKKMLSYLDKNQKYMTCLEMMDSLWYRQTPNRVINLIDNYLKK